MQSIGNASREKLNQLVARIERLNAEKDELAADIRDVYGEAKAFGFDTKVLRKIIARRKQDESKQSEEDALVELYEGAID